MNKIKVYISGAITDKATGGVLPGYMEKFAEAAKVITEAGFIAVSPTTLPHNHDKSWGAYMREDLKAMLECDVVYGMPCHKDSRGAKIELNLAQELGLFTIIDKGNNNLIFDGNPPEYRSLILAILNSNTTAIATLIKKQICT
jgi:hypothetical protein